VSDLASMNRALNLFQSDTGGSGSLGTASTVYVSLPDSSATCSNLGLPALPSGYTYHCSATSTYQNADGTGWIPVNFTSISFTTPLGKLPIDPSQNASSSLYYTYVTGSGGWTLSSLFESQRYRLGGSGDKASTDGGASNQLYEQGSNLALNPLNDNGLVGWWKMDEGNGTTTSDSSGNGNTGTLTNGPSWQTVGSCKTGGCLSFDGSDDYVDMGDATSLRVFGPLTISSWVYFNGLQNQMIVIRGTGAASSASYYLFVLSTAVEFSWANAASSLTGTFAFQTGTWYHIVAVRSGSNNNWSRKIYINGSLVNSDSAVTGDPATSSQNVNIGRHGQPLNQFNGRVDDVRIYNRALSAAEVTAMYNATK
jgi:hypothetical protein